MQDKTVSKVGNYYGTTHLEKIGNIKFFNLEFSTSTSYTQLPQGTYTQVATLPSDCCPLFELSYMASYADSNGKVVQQAELRIETDGTVKMYNYYNNRISLVFNVMFV